MSLRPEDVQIYKEALTKYETGKIRKFKLEKVKIPGRMGIFTNIKNY